MRLSLKDQISLIYTSAGSARNAAAFIGVSDRTIRRILHAGEPGHAARAHSPAVIAAVQSAFRIHTEVAREQARVDKLPFNPEIPIFIQRMEYTPFEQVPTGDEVWKMTSKGMAWVTEYERVPQRDKNGRLVVIRGDRILADHTHWISDELRAKYLHSMQKTGMFLQASIGSVVDLILYNRQATLRQKSMRGNEEQRAHARSILQTIEQNIKRARIFTTYTSMERGHAFDDILYNIEEKLRSKHQPATGSAGTRLADQILLQVDSRNVNQKTFRGSHPIPPKRRKKKSD